MTTPVPHGYPDWGRYAAQADIEILGTSNLNLNGSETFGRFFVGGVKHIAYIYAAGGNNSRVTLETYTAETGGTLLSEQVINCRNPGGFDFSIPVQGPWLAITVTSVGGAISYDLNAWTVAGNLASVTSNLSPRYALSQTGTAVGAAATVLTEVPYTYVGRGHWFIRCTATTFIATLQTVTAGGTVQNVDQWTEATPLGARQIHIPSFPLRLSVNNTSGAGATYTTGIVVGGIDTAT